MCPGFVVELGPLPLQHEAPHDGHHLEEQEEDVVLEGYVEGVGVVVDVVLEEHAPQG